MNTVAKGVECTDVRPSKDCQALESSELRNLTSEQKRALALGTRHSIEEITYKGPFGPGTHPHEEGGFGD